jgi:hypothetical protein
MDLTVLQEIVKKQVVDIHLFLYRIMVYFIILQPGKCYPIFISVSLLNSTEKI